MKAMILAAGFGTRLCPLTLDRAKPAIPLLGRPLLVHLVEALLARGVTEFRANVHHLPATVERIFASHPWRDLPISFSHEPEVLGTAGGLKANEPFFDDGTFLMVNGDVVFDCPLDKAIALHKESQALSTLVLYQQEAPYRYTPVRIDEHGRLSNFKGVDLPGGKLRPAAYVFTGVHILEPEVFRYIPTGRFSEINDEVYPAALKNGEKICGHPVEGYWNDLGDPARYLQAQRDLFDQSGADRTVCVADGARIEAETAVGPYVSVGSGCLVERGAEVENSVLWEDVHVRAGVRVVNSILGSGVTVESTCVHRIVTRNGEAPLVSP